MKAAPYISLFTSLILSYSASNLFAQEPCGTMNYLKYLIKQDSTVGQEYDKTSSEFISFKKRKVGAIEIPVVVHVVHNGEMVGVGSNISDAQIQSAIDVLNEDFQRKNPDRINTNPYYRGVVGYNYEALAANCEVTFCLANVTRTYSNITAFSANGYPDVKNVIKGWDKNNYLNIWVCKLSNNLLGYATFPETAETGIDGVVIDLFYFGRAGNTDYSYAGRAITHEVGHWLGLRHIWGDSFCGDDYVSDTWPQSKANTNATGILYYGNIQLTDDSKCYDFSLCNPYIPNLVAMSDNFMDYSLGNCMNFFSYGQKARIWYHLNTFRSNFIENSCQTLSAMKEVTNISAHIIFSNYDKLLRLEGNVFEGADVMVTILSIQGKLLDEFNLGRYGDYTYSFSNYRPGTYIIKVNSKEKWGVKRILIIQ